MVQYINILMKYYELASWFPYAFVNYKDDCPPFEEKCPQQLMNTNNYTQATVTILWIPCLTVDSCTYRNCTDYHKVSKSAVFGYPAHCLELNLLKKEKLKTKFPPFIRKPQVAEDPTPINKQTAV